ncbi:MAG: hydroxyacylglutathione hydrolase [Rhodobacterales bacterium]|nr:MAG: hydroxyacylglutathione hydrolase [Rhodobacterales bacterium]
MPLDLLIVPCLVHNYAYLLHDPASGDTALIDAPDDDVIAATLTKKGWTLTDIALTHHHWDHIDGLEKLRGQARVTGGADDAERLPRLDRAVREGDSFVLCGTPVQVFDVPGHTLGHIAFYLPGESLLFSADSLMTMGCGRLFEGDPAMMWASLQKLRALPADTRVMTGHEYGQTNIDFALSLGEDNPALARRAADVKAARDQGLPTTGATLATEAATNPFLRADAPALAAAIGMEGADPVAVFTEIRKRRDNW